MEMSGMNAVQISKLPGVADLPIKVRVKFAKALLEEANGNTEEANRYLEEAIDLEATG